MTNFQVYRKILAYSPVIFLVDLLGFALMIGCCFAGFAIGNAVDPNSGAAIIGLIIGFLVGIIAMALISILVSNRIKAAQIAMMVKGVTEGELPEHTFKAGFEEIKGRFGKITVFFFITNAIKGIFRQLGRGITRVGQAVGGDVGGSIGSAVDSAIQTLIAYLCDCCLGWVLYRKDVNSFKAACEGAVIFFKHGKTLIRNVGRIFGMGFLSFLLVGGALFGGFYLLFSNMPTVMNSIITAIGNMSEGEIDPVFQNPATFAIAFAAFSAVIIWSMLHSILIRPFILTGVMRNFMAAGIADIPTESDFAILDNKSSRFRRLHERVE